MRAAMGALVAALAMAGCGGSASNGIPAATNPVPSGSMRVSFTVAGPLDFSKYQYWIVFNSSGNGLTPEATGRAGDRSFAIQVGGSSATATQAFAFEWVPGPGPVPPVQLSVAATPAQLALQPSGSAAASTFAVTFQRSLFASNRIVVTGRWRANAFTARAATANASFVDSLGPCGSCFASPVLFVRRSFTATLEARGVKASVPAAARILSIAIANAP